MKNKIFGISIFLITTTLFLFGAKSFFLTNPPVLPDEAYFFSVSHNLSSTGKLSTDIFGKQDIGPSFHEYDEFPLYFYVLSIWMKLFGESIEVMRSLSVVFGLIVLMLLYLSLQLIFHNRFISAIGILLLSIDSFFGFASRFSRMEPFILICMLYSFVIILRNKMKLSPIHYLALAILSGFSVLSHPFGLLTPIFSACLSWAMHKKRNDSFYLSVTLIFGTIFSYLLWFVSLGSRFPYLVHQIKLLLTYKAAKIPYVFLITEFKNMHYALFIIDIVCVLILLFLAVRSKNLLAFVFLIFTITSFVLSVLGKEQVYLVYPQLFIVFGIAFILQAAYMRTSYILKSVVLSLLSSLLILYGSVFFIKYIENKNNDYHASAQKIVSMLSPAIGSTICLSVSPDPYFELIKLNKNLVIREFSHFPVSERALFSFLDSCDSIVINYYPIAQTEYSIQNYINNNAFQILSTSGPSKETYIISLKPLQSRIGI